MPKAAQVETTNTTTEDEDKNDDDGLSFEDRLKIVLGSIRKEEDATAEKPAVFDWKEGVNQKDLQEQLQYKKPTSMTVGLGSMRDFLRYESMIVEHKGEKITGQQLRQRLNLARGKFAEHCKDAIKANSLKIVRPGVELPQFRTRSTEVPDALGLMNELLGDIAVE